MTKVLQGSRQNHCLNVFFSLTLSPYYMLHFVMSKKQYIFTIYFIIFIALILSLLSESRNNLLFFFLAVFSPIVIFLNSKLNNDQKQIFFVSWLLIASSLFLFLRYSNIQCDDLNERYWCGCILVKYKDVNQTRLDRPSKFESENCSEWGIYNAQ